MKDIIEERDVEDVTFLTVGKWKNVEEKWKYDWGCYRICLRKGEGCVLYFILLNIWEKIKMHMFKEF